MQLPLLHRRTSAQCSRGISAQRVALVVGLCTDDAKYKSVEQEFCTDFHLLIGDNESGKSSALLALELVLSASRRTDAADEGPRDR